MKLLFLDAYFEPEQIAFTHLENDLLQELVDLGHEVEVVCPVPTRGVDRETAEIYKERTSEYLYGGHVHVIRFYAPSEGIKPAVRALRYFWCNLRTYQIGISVKKIDAVFANSTPPTQGWIAGKVAKKLGVPFVYSLQDIFPDSLVNAKLARPQGILWNIGRRIEDATYKKATKIITLSENFKKNIISKGVPENKIVVIPNWVDTSNVYPIERAANKIVKKYNLNPQMFYACYCGNLGHSQNLELLVEVAKKIQDKDENIQFVIIGEGAAKGNLRQKIKANSLKNVILLPFQPYEEIAHVFSLGDVGLILSKAGIGGSSVPSKTWSIMSAGRPVLASFDLDSSLASLLQETESGIVTAPYDIDGFIQALFKFKNNRQQTALLGEHGRRYVVSKLDKKRGVGGYIGVIEQCVTTIESRGIIE